MTNVAIELPEDIAARLGARDDLQKLTLEALAAEGYRSGLLTRGEVQRLLDLSWHEIESIFATRKKTFGKMWKP
jgi:hypothetical protein